VTTRANCVEILRERVAVRRALVPPMRRRELRLQVGLTLREVADAVGADVATVSRWERGEREPRGEHLNRYVAVLQMLEDEGAGDSVS
jgi:transcriptional regulator with XRE-family HTH domain